MAVDIKALRRGGALLATLLAGTLVVAASRDALAATLLVTNTNDSGAGSLRQALLDANATAEKDTIRFAIPGTGPHVITPTSALPTITNPVVINGYSQAGATLNTLQLSLGTNANLQIVLDGTDAGAPVGLWLLTENSEVRGLVIRNWDYGIRLDGGPNGDLGGHEIVGNFIGALNADGTVATGDGNSVGVHISGSPDNVVGGTSPARRNLISGNTDPADDEPSGITIAEASATGNEVRGNLIGTTRAGTVAHANTEGVVVEFGATRNRIGGSAFGAGNVISGNTENGIFLAQSSENDVQGNRIGTNAAGAADLGNGGAGVALTEATNSRIGGTLLGTGNIISGNENWGIIAFGGSEGNRIRGNWIGTDLTGDEELGNGAGGVLLFDSNNHVGDLSTEARNVIAFNAGPGVRVADGTGNRILSNSIYDNDGLGIDLGPAGVTANDVDDPDTGANDLQNFPVLNTVVSSMGTTTVTGTLNSTPNTTFTLQFFASPTGDPSGFGEGRVWLGNTTVRTNAEGDATFSVTFDGTLPAGWVIAATATNPAKSTSEFSAFVTV